MGLFSLIGGIISGKQQAKASKQAARLEYQAAQEGIAEQARQFNVTRQDFAPYQEAGQQALTGLSGLMGLNGGDQQASAISALRDSPLYRSLYSSGEEAVLQNASATGGLRGGNAQASLYEMGEGTLSSVIAQQLANYGGLVGMGTGAAGAVGNFGANSVANQAMLRSQGAQAQAQDRLVRGGIAGQNWANAGSFIEDTIGQVASGGFNWKSLF